MLSNLRGKIKVVMSKFGPDAGIIRGRLYSYEYIKRRMMIMKKMKVALIGAGSLSFALGALQDMVLSGRLKNQVDLEIALMDIGKIMLREHTITLKKCLQHFHILQK